MMKRAVLLTGLMLASPGVAGAQSPREVKGPDTLCGEAFALPLEAGESACVDDTGPDFIFYHVVAADGPFLIYEGNAPERHDEEIVTGRRFPSIVAIHDQRQMTGHRLPIRPRLLTGAARAAKCPAERPDR